MSCSIALCTVVQAIMQFGSLDMIPENADGIREIKSDSEREGESNYYGGWILTGNWLDSFKRDEHNQSPKSDESIIYWWMRRHMHVRISPGVFRSHEIITQFNFCKILKLEFGHSGK